MSSTYFDAFLQLVVAPIEITKITMAKNNLITRFIYVIIFELILHP